MEIESILALYLSAVMPSNIFRTLRSALSLPFLPLPLSTNIYLLEVILILQADCSYKALELFFLERAQPANIGMEHDKKIGDLKFWAAFLFYDLRISLFLTIYFPAAPSPEIMP